MFIISCINFVHFHNIKNDNSETQSGLHWMPSVPDFKLGILKIHHTSYILDLMFLMYKPCRLAPPLLGRVMVPLWCCSQCSGFSRGLTVTTFRARVSPACRISCTTRSCDARTTFSPLIYKDWFGSTLIYITAHMNCVSSICFRHWNFNFYINSIHCIVVD